jgi:hypothetical protein
MNARDKAEVIEIAVAVNGGTTQFVHHGGCLGCVSLKDNLTRRGVEHCTWCRSFACEWDKPSLYKEETSNEESK